MTIISASTSMYFLFVKNQNWRGYVRYPQLDRVPYGYDTYVGPGDFSGN